MTESGERASKRRKINGSTMTEVPASIDDRNSTQTAGKIEKIWLKNILCHSSLIVELNECVNLIQGKNGSGKSSIVASIIAGFGGSSLMADKGKSFKNLVQNGKQQAVIQIFLSNLGVNSYKKDLFGDQIIVERRININSGSSYRLKDGKGHTISHKKEDLNRLLARFNIMVDNPVVILSQEHAKTFLSNAKPANLFKFYMLSTGMQQLIDAYEYLKDVISHCSTLLKMKEENLQTLAKDVKEWERKGQAIQSLDKKKRKVTLLRVEKSVAELNALVAEVTDIKDGQEKCLSRMEKIKSRIKLMEGEKKEIETEKIQRDEESQIVALKVNDLQLRKDTLGTELGEKKKSHREAVHELRVIEKEVAIKRNDVSTIRKSLAEDNSIAHKLWCEKNEQLAEERDKLNKKLLEFKQILDVATVHEQNLKNTDDLKTEFEHAKIEYQSLDRRLYAQQRELKGFQQNSNSTLLIFSPQMPHIVEDIERAHQRKAFVKLPVGPIGAYIKCIEPEWVHIAEKIILPIITSFIVCCRDDYLVLKDIFKNRMKGPRQPKIIVTKFRDKVHDVSRFCVRSDTYKSLWSVLEVGDIHAANVLLDQISVETILLIPTSQEAGELLKDASRVPLHCKKAYTLHGDLYYPDPKFRIYSGNGSKHTRYLQVSPKEKIQELQESIKFTREEVLRTKAEMDEKKEEKRIIEEDRAKSIERQKKYRMGILRLEKTISDLRDKEELPPPDIFQLQTDLKESVAQLDEIESKKRNIETDVGTKKEEVMAVSEQYKISEADSHEFLQKVYKIQESSAAANVRHRKVLVDIRRLQEKKTEQNQLLDTEFNNKIKDLDTMIAAKSSILAESNSTNVETDRKTITIERELKALIAAIESEESKVGDLATIIGNVERRTTHFKKVKTEVDDQNSYIKSLKKALTERKKFLVIMQDFNETYIKSCFKAAVARRNLRGDLVIDHQDKTLSISVQKSTEGASSQMHPLSMMSGGEKSFSTVSFILALWDVINSPIRILDEFDVFMDDVARKQVTDLMLSSIKKEFQYMFITPLDYSRKAAHFNTIVLNPPRRDE